MKRSLICIALFGLTLVGATAQAASALGNESPEGQALRGECAGKYSAAYGQQDSAKTAAAATAPDLVEYSFVYHKAQFKGEHVAGQNLACTEQQYAAFLNTVDPTRVMEAYPTAAGRPSVKAPRLPRTPSLGR